MFSITKKDGTNFRPAVAGVLRRFRGEAKYRILRL